LLLNSLLDLVAALALAVEKIDNQLLNPLKIHETVKNMYSWTDVAARTERVYKMVLQKPDRNETLADRFLKYNGTGLLSGKLSVMIVALNSFFLWILEFFYPSSDIELCKGFDLDFIHRLKNDEYKK
jgi:phosphatidylinositol glycan class A protein